MDEGFLQQYMTEFIDDFGYLKSSLSKEKSLKLIFRNEKYYFLFPSVSIAEINRSQSVNSYKVIDVETDEFITDFLKHYNSIDQHLKCHSTQVM